MVGRSMYDALTQPILLLYDNIDDNTVDMIPMFSVAAKLAP